MQRVTIVAGLVLHLASGVAYGQVPSETPAPISDSAAQKSPNGSGIPPCPTFAEQTAALGAKTSSGSEKLAAQPAERSGILPSAGTAGSGSSAAPTMQDDGRVFRSPLDCPLIPGHPNAVTPGATKLPQLSK